MLFKCDVTHCALVRSLRNSISLAERAIDGLLMRSSPAFELTIIRWFLFQAYHWPCAEISFATTLISTSIVYNGRTCALQLWFSQPNCAHVLFCYTSTRLPDAHIVKTNWGFIHIIICALSVLRLMLLWSVRSFWHHWADLWQLSRCRKKITCTPYLWATFFTRCDAW